MGYLMSAETGGAKGGGQGPRDRGVVWSCMESMLTLIAKERCQVGDFCRARVAGWIEISVCWLPLGGLRAGQGEEEEPVLRRAA